ncbi:hypothetical protein pipiens_000156, partial [Culex pipiens pipiens]
MVAIRNGGINARNCGGNGACCC